MDKEKPSDLEAKHQKLTADYTKVKTQATVLKKAVLEEQAKNYELKETVKKHEQQLRKHAQEMESLTFRNDQLTKRISVLQKELQVNNSGKKHGKNNKRSDSNVDQSDLSVLDEELQKRILENAQLVSRMTDKDYEISDFKEKIDWLESKVSSYQRVVEDLEEKYKVDTESLKKQLCDFSNRMGISTIDGGPDSLTDSLTKIESTKELDHWKEQAERWRKEYELLHSRPESNEQLTKYYETQIRDLIETKQLAVSETKSLWAENLSLTSRLEQLTLENKHLETCLTKSNEELVTTTENYKGQLDAMTEHLAAQNEKITKQCDEIQLLRHKLAQVKK